MISTGWNDPATLEGRPARPASGHDMLMAVYGPSFAINAALETARTDSRITLRAVGGPGAPPSHSFAAFQADVPLRKADVVVFGVLSSAVGQIGSMSGLIWLFENPAPYTFPRYRVRDGRLDEEVPLIRSEAEFREAFQRQPARWAEFRQQLARSDKGYDWFTFEESSLDASSVVRLIRRGWVAHRQSYDQGVYDPMSGLNPQAEEVEALKLMIAELRRQTCARGERLVVLLLHTLRQSDHLFRALEPTLKAQQVEFISTHALFSANDARNFVADGHYTAQANALLADALRRTVRDGQAPSGCAPPAPAVRP